MRFLSKTALAASLAVLAACGGGEQNVAANNASDELYNLAPDDLGVDNLVGTESLDNGAAGSDSLSVDNAVDQNAAGNAQ